MAQQSINNSKYYKSLSNLFEHKLNKQRVSLTLMQQKINANSLQQKEDTMEFNLSQAMKFEDSHPDNRKTIYELDNRQTSNNLYPQMMHQVTSQKDSFKTIQEKIKKKEGQLESQKKGLAQEDMKLQEFREIQNQIEKSYVTQKKELELRMDQVTNQVMENQRLNQLIRQNHYDIRIFYDRNEYQHRKISIEDKNITDLNAIITQQFQSLEADYYSIQNLANDKAGRREVYNRKHTDRNNNLHNEA